MFGSQTLTLNGRVGGSGTINGIIREMTLYLSSGVIVAKVEVGAGSELRRIRELIIKGYATADVLETQP